MTYKFLIYISYSYAFPIGEPLEREIQKRGYQIKWFTDEPETKEKFSTDKAILENVHQVLDYQPHIVLCITDSVADFITGIKVQIFHGFLANKHSDKKGHFRIRGFFDLYCTQGPSTTKPFEKLKQKHKHFEVIETGWPKVDPLFPIKHTFNKKPVILISSTFSPKYSWTFNNDIIKEIERLSSLGKWEFKVVLHPKLSKDKVEKIKAIQGKNLIYYDTTHLIPLFEQADIMFSDTTSAITEFLLQEKPVVTYKNNKPGKHLINIDDASELENAISKALTRPTTLLKNISEYIVDTHPYFDGKSSKRVITNCIHFFDSDRSYLKKKPLNIVRKYNVRKKLGYFSLQSYRKSYAIK